ncbi:MTH1187 family thiamine-binding protein [Methanobrevibacter sp.]|uniref:MTH1187 family thiamine-binding protein n=1 Tax=Methanobrevibacter sp. TaxID=66852 RepID=UPI003D7DC57B
MITCDFAILPVGTETTECKEYVTVAVQSIKDSGLNYQLTGMGTQIEADTLEELYSAIANAQEAIFKIGIGRVYTVIKVDDRRDLENRTLDAKIDTVNKILK